MEPTPDNRKPVSKKQQTASVGHEFSSMPTSAIAAHSSAPIDAARFQPQDDTMANPTTGIEPTIPKPENRVRKQGQITWADYELSRRVTRSASAAKSSPTTTQTSTPSTLGDPKPENRVRKQGQITWADYELSRRVTRSASAAKSSPTTTQPSTPSALGDPKPENRGDKGQLSDWSSKLASQHIHSLRGRKPSQTIDYTSPTDTDVPAFQAPWGTQPPQVPQLPKAWDSLASQASLGPQATQAMAQPSEPTDTAITEQEYKARSHSVLRMKRVRPHPYRKEQAQESLSFAEREKMWAETAEKNDRLLNRPPRNHQYLSSRGSLRPTDNRFNFSEQSQSQKNHPKLQEKLDRGVPLTPQMEQWYKDVPLHVKSHSTAGVPHPSSLLGGDASASSAPVPAFPEAIQDKPDENANDPFQEEAFHARPSVKLIIPDILKSMLVDDWENVTKNMQLVPIPHPKPVSQIIQDYTQYELPKRIEGSSHEHLLVETLVGLKDYFERALGRLLLYRFERGQYAEIHKKWNSGDPDYKDKKISDLYGAEHLMRLIVSLPGLIAQTNMDQQSVNRLREELLLFCAWLSRNLQTYFVNTYETPTSDYIEKAKSLE